MRRFLMLMMAFVLHGSLANAESARTLGWVDLLPNLPPVEDPLAALTADQQYDLWSVREITWAKEAGADIGDAAQEEKSLRKKLGAEGVDVDAFLAGYEDYIEELTRRGSVVRSDLNGSMVRIPGYLLPLEFEGDAASEFLLVPYVGACIHTPPPPPNQIIYLKVDPPYRSTGLFDPVWVTGDMTTQGGSKDLTLFDGTLPIDVGYSINAANLQPYTD
jgi:hypothetical protein